MTPKQEFTLSFSTTPKMADALTKVLRIKSKRKGEVVKLSSYIRELVLKDIQENYLKKNIGSKKRKLSNTQA